MKSKIALYGSILFIAATTIACREKRFKDLTAEHCPVTASGFPETDTAEVRFANAFSPNGDGINDLWFPFFNRHVTAVEFKIIDLSGKILFTSTGMFDGWAPTDDLKKGMTQYVARVRATSSSGNVMDTCVTLYAYYCTPPKAPVGNNQLLFVDQIDMSFPDNYYLPTREKLDFCK